MVYSDFQSREFNANPTALSSIRKHYVGTRAQDKILQEMEKGLKTP